MNKKLRPCPFCGGKVETAQHEGMVYDAKGKVRVYPYIAVYCVDCGATIEEQDREELVRKWNTRTPDIVRCGECKYFKKKANLKLVIAYNYCRRYAVNRKPEDFCSCWGKRRN